MLSSWSCENHHHLKKKKKELYNKDKITAPLTYKALLTYTYCCGLL